MVRLTLEILLNGDFLHLIICFYINEVMSRFGRLCQQGPPLLSVYSIGMVLGPAWEANGLCTTSW